MTREKVGVLGPGNVGQSLASAFRQEGHEVMLGSRDPKKREVQDWLRSNHTRGSVGAFREAAEFGSIIVLAVPGIAVENALEIAGPDNLSGKLLIDVTNPLESKGENTPPELFVGGKESLAERIQAAVPEAKVVKAFNITNYADMYRPEFPGGPPDMYYCGNDGKARKEVHKILEAFGHHPVDLGGLHAARYLEALAMIWIIHSMRTNTWRHGFKILEK